MSNNLIAIDQGTTGTTCLVVEMRQGRGAHVVGRGYAEFPQHFPQPGFVEHDLEEIWQSTGKAVKQALTHAGIAGRDIAAVGITNQRETVGVWDTAGKPQHRAIVWQDRRTADTCRQLREAGFEERVRARTGLVLDPYFSATKLAWLLDAAKLRARARANELRFGTIDTWLIWKLTQGKSHATDITNASRTMLFDIHEKRWSSELLEMLGDIPPSLLPTVLDCNELYGKTQGVDFLPDGIPITGVAGDQQAALFGQACFTAGMAKCTYGTGAFALVNVGEQPIQSTHGLLSTIAWQLKGEGKTIYAIEGSVFVAGAVVQWLRDGLQFFSSSAEIEEMAAQVPDAGGLVMVPALTGLGAPHWRPDARGLITGLTRGTTRAHIARACLEGIALQVQDLLSAMSSDIGRPLSELRVDGGAAANNLLMQLQSDLLQLPISRPQVVETTALGAVFLAGLGVGLFQGVDDIVASWQIDRVFSPKQTREQLQPTIDNWRRAVALA